jgi:hypothetical protein
MNEKIRLLGPRIVPFALPLLAPMLLMLVPMALVAWLYQEAYQTFFCGSGCSAGGDGFGYGLFGLVVLVFGAITLLAGGIALASIITAAVSRRLMPLYPAIGVVASPLALLALANDSPVYSVLQVIFAVALLAALVVHRAADDGFKLAGFGFLALIVLTGVISMGQAATGDAQAIPPQEAAEPFDCANVEQIPLTECAALVAFFEAAAQSGLYAGARERDWLASDTPCGWPGLGCKDGHVTSLRWDNNFINTQDQLPPELGDLSELRFLEVRLAATGPLPAELGRLTKLEELRLSQNELSGPIPAELCRLIHREELWLGPNDLSGPIPVELGGMTELKVLALAGIQLTGRIPVELGRLTNLEHLWLSGNQLTGTISAELGGLTSLQKLWLNHNQLSGPIPAELSSLSNLEWLRLDVNQLTGGIPVELGNLSALSRLEVDDSQLQFDDKGRIVGIPPGMESVCFGSGDGTGCRQ